MRAQAGFEVYFSISAFALVVVYIFLELINQYPSYFNQIEYEKAKSEVYQLSELLINDPGFPVNWENLDISQIKRIGLNDEKFNKTNLISAEKSVKLNEFCKNFPEEIKKWLGIKSGYAIYLSDSQNHILINCNNLTSTTHLVQINRIVAIYNHTSNNITYGELVLELS